MKAEIFNTSKSHDSLEHRLKGILRKLKTKKKHGKKRINKTRKAKTRRHHKQKTSMRGGRGATVTPEHPAIGELVNLRNRIEGFVAQIQDIKGQAKAIKDQAKATEDEISSENGDIYTAVTGAVNSVHEETVTNMLFELEKNLQNFQYELDQLIEKTVEEDLTPATAKLNEMIEFIRKNQIIIM